MSNSDQKEKDKAAMDWLTKPIYKIMIVALVLLELLGKEMDGGIKQTFHIILWTGLGLVVILNIISIITGFGSRKEEKHSNEDESDT
jgi:hypothetical protein